MFQKLLSVRCAYGKSWMASRANTCGLQVVLEMGNYMNASNKNESSIGFNIKFLPKVTPSL